jgi:single-strand DNA-binding protein
MGRLTHDAELRYTQSGQPLCTLAIATTRRYEQSGEWKESTEFTDAIIWGKRGEALADSLKKGTAVFVEGRLQTRSWDDQASGQKRSKTEVVADDIIFTEPRPTPHPAPAPQPNRRQPDPDEIPF